MSKAFIAWSGNHAFALALAEHIGKQNKGVECIVGGSSVGGIGGRTVFDTVMEQMKQCDQAILLVQKHREFCLIVLFLLEYFVNLGQSLTVCLLWSLFD